MKSPSVQDIHARALAVAIFAELIYITQDLLVLNVAIPCVIIIVSTTVQGGELSSSADTDCFPPPQKKYKGLSPKDTHVRCIIIIALSLPSVL